jgi:hypothetical protein
VGDTNHTAIVVSKLKTMMLLDLPCAECIMEQVEKGIPHKNEGFPILTPYEPVNNSGIYSINCSKGHTSQTYIDNIDFEILFDYSINAIVDGYYREAVSSFTSSMERYFEFFIKVILRATGKEFETIQRIWKTIASQSERQLGAYIMLYNQTFDHEPKLLSQNKEVPFRNSVIHKGYIPSKEEAIDFGDSTLEIIEKSLIKLIDKFPEAVKETFNFFGYARIAKGKIKKQEEESGIEKHVLCVNIMTTIDVNHGREINENDGRKGDILKQITRVLERRTPRSLQLVKDKPRK